MWLAVLLAFVLGWLGYRWFWPFVLAVVATVTTLVFVYSWWAEIGIVHRWLSMSIWNLLVFLVMEILAFAFGKMMRRLLPASASS